jgi:hypothetical protein
VAAQQPEVTVISVVAAQQPQVVVTRMVISAVAQQPQLVVISVVAAAAQQQQVVVAIKDALDKPGSPDLETGTHAYTVATLVKPER